METKIDLGPLGNNSLMPNQTILLVDDELDILEFISFNLTKEGYTVHTAGNGLEAIEMALKISPDLILLDVMMPHMDGIEACLQLRQQSSLNHCVIAFLTARGEDFSQVAGFDSGADDYILKSIKPRVLTSRVKALLRRPPRASVANSGESRHGITIDRERYIVIQNDTHLNLPKKEFELLFLLWSVPGKVFAREAILSSVWGNDVVVGDRTIDVHIRKLRSKLGDQLIETVKGVGYKFSA